MGPMLSGPKQSPQSGQVILFALLFMGIMLVISASLVGYTTLNVRESKNSYYKKQALYLAEAGVEKAVSQLNVDPNYNGESNTALGDGEFSVSISTVDANTKRITATGFVPGSAAPKAAKTVKATAFIDSSVVSFNFGIQAGAGGFSMTNNSRVIGNVFSNGDITGTGIITGDATVAAGQAAAADQQWSSQNSDFNFGNITARKDVAQSFVLANNGVLNKVSVYLRKVGTPGNLTVRILSDAGGKPSKTVLTSGTINSSSIGSGYALVDGTFSKGVNLLAGQTYWLMLSAPAINGSRYYVWGLDSTDGYAGGTGKYSASYSASTPVWNSAGGDLNFKVFLGGVAPVLSGVVVQGNASAESMTSCTVGHDAYFLTTNTCSVGGTAHPGTAPTPPQDMPISDEQIEEWKQIADAGGLISGDYTVSGTKTLGPIRINGNLTFGNGATLILDGPVWVKGNITIANNANLRVGASLGNAGTVLLADNPDDKFGYGKISIYNNATLQGNGNPGSFLIILTTNNSDYAMDIENNSAGAIFYASAGTINVSNNAGGSQITGYKIHLENNATVNYNNGLQSATFSNGPGGSWVFLPGSYVVLP